MITRSAVWHNDSCIIMQSKDQLKLYPAEMLNAKDSQGSVDHIPTRQR